MMVEKRLVMVWCSQELFPNGIALKKMLAVGIGMA
jgi:hypothetical protein